MMALIKSDFEFIQSELNLNNVYANTYNSSFNKNVNENFMGKAYKDAFEADYETNFFGAAIFAGSGFTQDSAGALTGGTVTGYFEAYWDGDSETYVLFLSIQNLSLSLKSLYNASLTPSTADDTRLINSALTGSDTFLLSSHNDSANGFSGNDSIYGNDGNDTLTGGTGKDYLQGGNGRDSFVFNALTETSVSSSTCDVITDFVHGSDKLNLSAIDASTILSGNNTFGFKGTSSCATSSGGEICYKQFNNAGTANDYTLVYIDNDADSASEAVIKLTGLVTLTASDFAL